MTVTLTAPAGDLELDGTGLVSTGAAPDELEVWLTVTGGAPLIEIPAEHIVSCTWSEQMDAIGSSSAELVVDHYGVFPDDGWIMGELIRVEREVRISFAGRVMHWGPIVSVSREPGGATVKVSIAGPEYWLGLRLVDGDADTWGREQIRTTREWSPYLDVSDPPWTYGGQFSYRSSEWRFTAEVWVAGSVDDDAAILSALANPNSLHPQQGGMVFARDLARDTWTTAVIHTTFTGGGGGAAPRTWFMSVGGELTSGDVVVREVSAQISPTSVGMDEDAPEVESEPVRHSWMEICGRVADLGISAWIDGSIDGMLEAGWRRPDVFSSEAARLIIEGGYGECDFGYSRTMRVARCWVRRGVEHDPGDLTLTAEDGPVVSWGTWTSGLAHPASEWVVANDEGFTSSYHDETLFGGIELQSFEAAPTGTAASDLKGRATYAAFRAAESLSEELSANVEMAQVAVLNVGDRVQVTLDDGPDAYDDLMRVTAKQVDPAAPTFQVSLTPWVEP